MSTPEGADGTSAVAEALHQAWTSNQPIDPIRDRLPGETLEAAYAVQAANTLRYEAAGRRVVGAKVGLTAKAVQQQFGVDSPDFGVLFSDMEVGDGYAIPPGQFIAPRVEAEMALVLGRDLAHREPTLNEVFDAVAWVWPALEIVDSRIRDWKISLLDTVADNASAAAYVLGAQPRRPEQVDFRLTGMVLERNGVVESCGAAAACLGNPLQALRWLAATLTMKGRPLRAGDLVLSGALGPMVAARPGDQFTARLNGLGDVGVSFGA